MRCPITYDEILEGRYSQRGLRLLARNLKSLRDLPLGAEEQRQEAARRAGKMSVQGVQPKLSARLKVKEGIFEIVDTGGVFILKPPSAVYADLPQNEDLTMKLAAVAGIEVPLHGMVYAKDGSLTYFIRRFDRIGHGKKVAVEDFAQLQEKSRDTKYNSSMEQVAATIERYCTFPAVEKVKLFRLTLFSFLTGNEDMHLKNFSLIRREGKVELSPAYDLLNTTIAIGNAQEEFALPLRGRKRKLTRDDLIAYFGSERLGLNARVISTVLDDLKRSVKESERLIGESFLSESMKAAYQALMAERAARLGV
ncbi:HipA domain-containing protein [Sphingobacteriales bacterium CHB3]|nr:HipA domain-containing protein [Sphingobacteriales bacterium CHB3]